MEHGGYPRGLSIWDTNSPSHPNGNFSHCDKFPIWSGRIIFRRAFRSQYSTCAMPRNSLSQLSMVDSTTPQLSKRTSLFMPLQILSFYSRLAITFTRCLEFDAWSSMQLVCTVWVGNSSAVHLQFPIESYTSHYAVLR